MGHTGSLAKARHQRSRRLLSIHAEPVVEEGSMSAATWITLARRLIFTPLVNTHTQEEQIIPLSSIKRD